MKANEPIILGQIGLSFHKVAAGIFHRILSHWGYRVEVITDVHEKIFKKQEQGSIDLLISAWLPGSHDTYLNPYKEQALKFTPIYQPYCIWGVPSYIPVSEVDGIEDLNKAEVFSKMDKDLNGIGMGAGISRFSVEMLSAYGLENNGYHFISNEFEAFCRIVEQKINEGRWFVIPLWYPQYLHTMFDIRPLKEVKGLLRGKDEATPILRKESESKFAPEHLKFLSNITLGNEAVGRMDYSFNKENKNAYQVAEEYMQNEYNGIEKFINTLKK